MSKYLEDISSATTDLISTGNFLRNLAQSFHDTGNRFVAGELFTQADKVRRAAELINTAVVQEGIKRKKEVETSESNISIEDGWIVWAGGECPVSKGVKIEYKGRGLNHSFLALSENLEWEHEGKAWDTVAYRVLDHD